MKALNIDIELALRYPFVGNNWKGLLLWLSVVITLYWILSYSIGFVMGLGLGIFTEIQGLSDKAGDSLETAVNGISALINFVLMIVFMPFVYGFAWRWMGVMRTAGYDAPTPEWNTAEMGTYWLDGAKLGMYIMLVSLALFLPFIPLALIPFVGIVFLALWLFLGIPCLLPFLWANVVLESPSRSLVGLFNFPRALEAGLRCYADAMATVVIGFILGIVFIPIIIASCCTCVGYPVATNLYYIILAHMFTQSYHNMTPEYLLNASAAEGKMTELSGEQQRLDERRTDERRLNEREADDRRTEERRNLFPEVDLDDRRD